MIPSMVLGRETGINSSWEGSDLTHCLIWGVVTEIATVLASRMKQKG